MPRRAISPGPQSDVGSGPQTQPQPFAGHDQDSTGSHPAHGSAHASPQAWPGADDQQGSGGQQAFSPPRDGDPGYGQQPASWPGQAYGQDSFSRPGYDHPAAQPGYGQQGYQQQGYQQAVSGTGQFDVFAMPDQPRQAQGYQAEVNPPRPEAYRQQADAYSPQGYAQNAPSIPNGYNGPGPEGYGRGAPGQPAGPGSAGYQQDAYGPGSYAPDPYGHAVPRETGSYPQDGYGPGGYGQNGYRQDAYGAGYGQDAYGRDPYVREGAEHAIRAAL